MAAKQRASTLGTKLPSLPEHVRDSLARLRDGVSVVAGDDLAALVVFGSAAKDEFDSLNSDVNVAVILDDLSLQKLESLSDLFVQARREASVEPVFMTGSEVKRSADVDPIRFNDIIRNRVVLAGNRDPFKGLKVQREHLRLEVELELRNLTTKLRRVYTLRSTLSQPLSAWLLDSISPMLISLAALLELMGCDPPPVQRSKIISAASRMLKIDKRVLEEILEMKHTGDAVAGAALEDLFKRYMRIVERAAKQADSLWDETSERAS